MSSVAQASKTMYYRIMQVRSSIGVGPKIRSNLEALGLKKRNHVVFQRVSPQTAHKLARVKELVKIELVDRPKTREELSQERKYEPGYTLVKQGSS